MPAPDAPESRLAEPPSSPSGASSPAFSEGSSPARSPSSARRASFPPGEEKRTAVAVAFFFALFVVSTGAVFYLFSNFITDFILALLLVALSSPAYRFLATLLGGRRWLASSITSALIVLIILFPLVFLASSIYDEAEQIYTSTQGSISVDKLDKLLLGDGFVAHQARMVARMAGFNYTRDTVKSAVQTGVREAAVYLYERVNVVVSNVMAFLFHFVIIVLTLFFLLIDGEKLKRYVFRLSPLPSDEEEILAQKFKSVGRAIVIGNGVVSIAQGVLGGIALIVADVPSAILWGTAMAVFAFLPLVGIGAITVPVTIYLVLSDRYLAATLFFAFCTTVAFIFENVIKPRLIGSQIQMHNVLIFLSIFGGIGMFGFLGILYGPLIMALFLTLADLYEHRYKKRILSIVPPGFPDH